MFHIFKNGIFTERVTGSTRFHPLVFYLPKRHFHREGYRLHPFSSSCFICSKTALSRRGLPAPPLFILLFHIFKNCAFTERVTGSTPFHPLVSYLQQRHVHWEGCRLHPFSSSCFISSKTAFSPKGLPAPPLFIVLFHIFKNDSFTERVTGSKPFSSSCFISSKTTFSRRRLPAPPLFMLLFHLLKKNVFTERVTGSKPFSSSCFISSKTTFSRRRLPAPPLFMLLFHFLKKTFSPRGLPAPSLFILLFHIFKNGIFTERVTGSTPFHPLVSFLQKRRFHRERYRLHPVSSSCFISSQTTFSPRGLPAPPLFILWLYFFENDCFTERVTGSTPFRPLVSYLQKRHFHREGYRLHPFSSSCFISSKTALSPRGLPAPPLFILLFHIFKNGIFTETVTRSTPFHALVSYLQKRRFHRERYQLHPLSSSCVISSKTTFFPERVTGSTPFHPLVSYLQNRHFHGEGYRLHPFSSSCFNTSKTALLPRGLPAPPLFILLIHIFNNGMFTGRVAGSTPFHPLLSYLPVFTERVTGSIPLFHIFKNIQKRHFHREGYRPHPFSSSCFISSKTTFSPRGLPAPPRFLLLFHIFKNGIFTERVTGSTLFALLFYI